MAKPRFGCSTGSSSKSVKNKKPWLCNEHGQSEDPKHEILQ